ncbi:MAG: hypothetical protein IT422_17185 [Pirellulaceae bacterium]|nr:hypothetical protein [Pirellulaceae bacterium]
MSVAERQEFKFTRQEFYDKLWSMPTTKVAAELEISDVMIGKVCRTYNIPKPYLGYWAKLAHGKKPKKTRLPRDDDPDIQSLVFLKYPHQAPSVNEPPRETFYDPDIQELLALARKLKPVKLPKVLRKPHPLISQWKVDQEQQEVEARKPWEQRQTRRREPTLDIHVSKESRSRALAVMDTLIKLVEKLDGRVAIVPPEREWGHATTQIQLTGEPVTSIRLRERTNMVKIKDPKAEYHWDRERTENIFNGLLLFDSGPSDSSNWMAKDGKKRRIEDGLVTMVTEYVRRVGEHRLSERAAEAARINRIEREIVEQAAAAERKRKQDELSKLQLVEQTKIEDLFERARAWRESQILRNYLDLVCQQHVSVEGSLAIDSEIADYLRWGFQQADRLDPLRPSPRSILDARID